MKQDQVKSSGKSTQTVEDQLKEQFNSVKNTETRAATRTVKLKYKSCCGCGCTTIEVERTVPFDSHLQNGDKIDRVEQSDVRIREY
jgi:PDZ domain-containing secreted protein